jgi:pantothenate synthetase
MGALHDGHASLIDAAAKSCGFVVVSVFVNPTQFAPTEDLAVYPRTPQQDLELCRRHGVNLVFMPTAEVMYPTPTVARTPVPSDPRARCPRYSRAGRPCYDSEPSDPQAGRPCYDSEPSDAQAGRPCYDSEPSDPRAGRPCHDSGPSDAPPQPAYAAVTEVTIKSLSGVLCGRSRPTHFAGVCTVVAKLFNIVGPDKAFFGAKDFQQATIIRRMAADLNFPVEVVVCPTVRESDGLARSSRNVYLTPTERRQAPALYQALTLGRDLILREHPPAEAVIAAMMRHLAKAASGQIDYLEIVDPQSLSGVQTTDKPVVIALAVRFGRARLIDNIAVDASPDNL